MSSLSSSDYVCRVSSFLLRSELTSPVYPMSHAKYAMERPPSPLRELGKALLALLKTASATLASGAADTMAPFVFGAILVVTTATALVLYSIGHVGVARLTDSGVFGLTKDAIDTLLAMARMQWRFLRQLRWSWWLETAARYERRYEDHILEGHDKHSHGNSSYDNHSQGGQDSSQNDLQANSVQTVHEHHSCIDTSCPLHFCPGYQDKIVLPKAKDGDVNVGVGEQHDEQPANPDGRRHRFRRIHHHHHKQHKHRRPCRLCRGARVHQRQPGSHIRLEKRRDWLRWFVGRPRMTTAAERRHPPTTVAEAVSEVAESIFGPALLDNGTDGLIPTLGAASPVAAPPPPDNSNDWHDAQSTNSESGIHFFADNFDPVDFNPNDVHDHPPMDDVVRSEPEFLSRGRGDLAPLPSAPSSVPVHIPPFVELASHVDVPPIFHEAADGESGTGHDNFDDYSNR